ncbi:hypothetical protein EYB25_003135 [Talaromyces marneffei]|uniref:Uncharacterized protein n=2 Tax=Talaromyces marneffei TaxID=37727 RepID=B6Q8U8_TALMQ|nr:uncharacterized protein EYB26_005643 [Talaromyces marneffei]EEA25902.1 hypothetical protein PMAA_069920 [Talaromyces marneffei ATCC 18224]KAE8554595.1 hypothetical protein EYB25_003135 [Talaromyces marneffei]QGA17966.1 hypothetical protein EYB26_005643 [Talaromyces marneffei]
MCLVKRTRRIVGDAERSQTTTYYCPRSRNGRTCSLTRYEDVEKRYQESSKVISPETSHRRQSTTKTSKDSIWKIMSGSFSKERSGKSHDDQARDRRDQQAASRHPQAQPPSSTQPDTIHDPFRPSGQGEHRRIVSTPLIIDRAPREIVERIRPATAPAPRPARPPRPRTPVEERPRARQHPVSIYQDEPLPESVYIHQNEPVLARPEPVSIHRAVPEPVRIEMTGARRPESDIDDHFSTFATFPSSSSSSSSSEAVTEFEEDESYKNKAVGEPYRPRTPEEKGTLRRRRDREYLNARREALQAQRVAEDAIRERREIENLANDVRHVLVNGRAGNGTSALIRRSTNPVREGRPVVEALPEGAGDATEDRGGFRRHSTVIARRNCTPPSYVIQEENRRLREESERVIENARARRNTQDPQDPADAFFRERHGGSNWRQSYYQ